LPVTYGAIPANWYPDPAGGGGLRYWDGAAWTEHVVPPTPQYYPPYAAWGPPPWKGAQLGRPAAGPGALAHPGRRLGARALDWLLMIPVFAILLTVSLLIFAPRFGPIFPRVDTNQASTPAPGFVWVYLTVFVCAILTGLVMVAYETVAVAKFGRTLGMGWLHIRPVRLVGGGPLGWGRAFGRAAIYWVAGLLGWIGLLDPLWCLWDDKRQCLHDKVVDSIVINDTAHNPAAGGGGGAAPAGIVEDAP
jgi:uncharacterized RDD family membrane protein YckC